MHAFVSLMWLSCAGLMMAGDDVPDTVDAEPEDVRRSRWQGRLLEVSWTVEAPEVVEGVAPAVAPASLAGKRVVFDFSKAEERLKPRNAPDDGWSVWAPVEDASRKDVVAFDGGDSLGVWRRLGDGSRVMEWHLSYSPDDGGKSGRVFWSDETALGGAAMDSRHLVFETPESGYVMPYRDMYRWDIEQEFRGVRFTVVDCRDLMRKAGEACREEKSVIWVYVSFENKPYEWFMKPWSNDFSAEKVVVSDADRQALKRLLAGVRAGECKSSMRADVPFWVIYIGQDVRLSSLEWALGMIGFASKEDAEEFTKLMARLVKVPVRLSEDEAGR